MLLLASKTLLAQSLIQGGNMVNFRVIRVKVVAPEKALDVNIFSKNTLMPIVLFKLSQNNLCVDMAVEISKNTLC
jgi:hypothetical protein